MSNESVKTDNHILNEPIEENKKIERGKLYFKLIELLPLAALVIALLLHLLVPNKQSFTITKYYPALLKVFIIIYFITLSISLKVKKIFLFLENKAPLLTAAFLILELWDLVTLKFKLLPMPYFPGPDKVLSSLFNDWSILGISTLYSLRLLFTGYTIGAVLGVITGIAIGWNKKANYWIGPIQRIIGPIPATAWIPIALTVFPTSFWASVFIIVLAVWFPVTVMTSSGIANVRNAFFEVAKTLGASQKYLIFKVAIPAASPTIFIGLFMGMGSSFLTLIVSEMLGVKAGLGWYINWAQGWADYSKVYASIIVIAVCFSSIITLLFKIKDKVLIWQRGLIKW
ncbi:MAG: ABC transporter permease subunit [Bacillota bacterium]|nr:ABC transporter permease subunit [Bacillota bacterium]